MAGSQKAISFLESLRSLNKLQLHSHYDQTNLSAHLDLPLSVPQRRKFLTLTMQSSGDLEIDSCGNSPAMDAQTTERRSHAHIEGLKRMDLAAMEGTNGLDVSLEGSQQGMEKKKLLVELAGMNNSSSKAFHESSKGRFHEKAVIEHAASNLSRICRFCYREFPSGRALGGHMRVHGALLDAHTSSANKASKQAKKSHKQSHDGKLRSDFHELNDTHVDAAIAADLSASSELEERQRAGMLKREKASSLECSEVNSESFYHKLDISSAHLHQEEGRNCADTLDSSYCNYSSGYGKSNNLQLHAGNSGESASRFDSKKHAGLYELRRNPKPNWRFIREQYHAANCHGNPAQYTPSPSAAGDQTNSPSPSPSPERAHPCSECGKVFFSWKALFGHMRCHPEREWRGIQPPESSVDLDCKDRMIVHRPVTEIDPTTELGYGACNIKLENTEETYTHVSKEETTVHANMTISQEEDEKTACDAMRTQGGAAAATSSEWQNRQGAVLDADWVLPEENKDKKDVIECSKSKQEALVHAHSEQKTGRHWSPIWTSAGKRSKRRRLQPSLTSESISNEIRFNNKQVPECKDQEDLDMANCLVLLSSAGKSMQEINKMGMGSTEESAFFHPGGKAGRGPLNVDHWEGASDAGDEVINDYVRASEDYEAEDDQTQNNGGHGALTPIKYQCSTCKKCFNSHQALGGHRASHRKMKGCFARMKNLAPADAHESSSEENDSEEADFLSSQLLLHVKGKARKLTNFQEDEECDNPSYKLQLKKKCKGHECSICHRIFATGQALGGHKRCHWTGEKVSAADTASVASSSTSTKKQELSPIVQRAEAQDGCGNSSTGSKKHTKEDVIDLNLPAPLDEEEEEEEEEEEVQLDEARGALAYAKLRPPIEAWNPAKVAQIPQVCSMQTF